MDAAGSSKECENQPRAVRGVVPLTYTGSDVFRSPKGSAIL